MSVKAAATHIDWTKLSTSLGLKTETVAALGAFRKRNEEARRVLSDLKEQKTAVDFAHYRKVLKNQAIVDEVEKAHKAFKPTSYDVSAQIKSIEAVEAKA
ncbi:ATP synthase d subunit, partial [Linnemannia gamsii]